MRIAFYADARSPIAINWVRWFTEHEADVHWISSRNANPPLPHLSSFQVLPCFPTPSGGSSARRGKSRYELALSAFLRHWVMPLRIRANSLRLGRLLTNLRPDLLHAMRIPPEGMIAADAIGRLDKDRPKLALSVWGNDFTLHASASPLMSRWTRTAVSGAEGLHADCERDLRLARAWGLPTGIPLLNAPGNGGIQLKAIPQNGTDQRLQKRFAIPQDAFYILNPRGLRGYARTDVFFRAIPLILRRIPRAHFLAPGMAGSQEAEDWVRRLNIENAVTLFPLLNAEEMAVLYRMASVTLSITMHDGTPISLLEVMAWGAFPVCGDLESIREWVTDGENGLLVPPGDPIALADAVVRAERDTEMRRRAADINRQIILKRATWNSVMPKAEEFYRRILDSSTQ